MRPIFILFLTYLLGSSFLRAQSGPEKLYDPDADAAADLRAAITAAAEGKKHVFVQIGGNWCPWCIKFDTLIRTEPRIDSLLREDYILLRVNYSKENRNAPLLELLGYPQRFGFPVFVILDSGGKRIHTQDSGLLEEGARHDPALVFSFLKNWAPGALNPKRYER